MTRRWLLALIGCLFLSACGGNNPYLEQSLKPAELQGKDKSWFLKNWRAERQGASLLRRRNMDLLPHRRRKIGSATLQFLTKSVRDYLEVRQRKNCRTIVIPAADRFPTAPATRSSAFERLSRSLAAKTIGLTANDFGHRRPSGNKYTHTDPAPSDLWVSADVPGSSPKLPEGALEQKVQDDQQDKNDDDSIHSRGASRLPQSWERRSCNGRCERHTVSSTL